MENQTPAPSNSENNLESLEGSGTVVEQSSAPANQPTDALSSQPTSQSAGPVTPAPSGEHNSPLGRLRRRFAFLNIYLLVFLLVLVVAALASVIAYNASKRTASNTSISSQSLDQKALEQLANTDTNVGSSAQILNVQSNAVFAGKVLVRDTLEVAGQLQVGGSLSLADLKVSGDSNLQSLAVSGDTALQGSLAVQKNLSVNGNGSFGGTISAKQLTVGNLQLNGDLSLNHHITAGGSTPSRSNGSALGSGGTASLSGSDTSGSITVNTGGGPGAGCFITVTFATKFNSTPHVLITPVGSAAASLAYYVNRSTSNFSVCSAIAPPANTSFGFDYFILD